MRAQLARLSITLFLGAVAGALAFLLAALFAGALLGALVALLATILALRRRSTTATVAYAAATALAAAAAVAPARALIIAAALFGLGLYIGAAQTSDAEAIPSPLTDGGGEHETCSAVVSGPDQPASDSH
jgi:uncharacterized membrane protein YedE/YeeE